MNVVLSGMFYPVAIIRYFLAALQRRDDITLVTAGMYTGNWIPWNGGMRLPDSYSYRPDISMGSRQVNFPIGYVESKLPFVPDLWIQVDAGMHLIGKPAHGRNIIIGTDPHVLDYREARYYADDFYCMQTPYMTDGDKYLPYAYDPVIHSFHDLTTPRDFDVALIGLHYRERNYIMSMVERLGLRVHYSIGQAYDDAADVYHKSLMGLNYSSKEDLTARVFELLGYGVLPIVNRVPDLARFFDDRHMIIVDSPDEAVEKIAYYAAHRIDAIEIANRGHDAVKPHTWDARVDMVLNGRSYEHN